MKDFHQIALQGKFKIPVIFYNNINQSLVCVRNVQNTAMSASCRVFTTL